MADTLQYRIQLDSAGFVSSLQQVLAGMNGLKAQLLAVTGAALGLRAAVGGLSAAFAAMQASMQTASQLQALSRRTGETIANLVILRRAFEDAGLGADSVGLALNMMQRALAGINEEGQPTNGALARLGVNLEQLRGLSPTAQLLAMGAALRAVPDSAERAALSMQLFGRSGAQYLAVLADPSVIRDATESAGSIAAIYDRSAAALDRAGNALSALRQAMQTVWAALAEPIAPVWEQMARELRAFADQMIRGAHQWQEPLRGLLGMLHLIMSSLLRLGRLVMDNAAAISALAQGVLALGAAWAAVKFASVLTALGQNLVKLTESTTALRQFADAGGTAALSLRNLSSAAAAVGPQLALVAATIGATIIATKAAQLEAFAAHMISVGRAADEQFRSLLDSAKAIETTQQRTEWLASAEKQLQNLRGQRRNTTDPRVTQLLDAEIARLELLQKKVRALSAEMLAAGQARANAAKAWAAAEEAAAERVKQLLAEVSKQKAAVAAALNEFEFNLASPAEQLKLLEQQIANLPAIMLAGGTLAEAADLQRTIPELIDHARREHATDLSADARANAEMLARRADQFRQQAETAPDQQTKQALLERAAEFEKAAIKLLALEEQRARLAQQVAQQTEREREAKQRIADDAHRLEAEAAAAEARTTEQKRTAILAMRDAELARLKREHAAATNPDEQRALAARMRIVRAQAAEQLERLDEQTKTQPQTTPPITPVTLPAADRLARIGLHIGGTAARGDDYARQTARATDAMLRRLERGIRVTITNPQQTAIAA